MKKIEKKVPKYLRKIIFLFITLCVIGLSISGLYYVYLGVNLQVYQSNIPLVKKAITFVVGFAIYLITSFLLKKETLTNFKFNILLNSTFIVLGITYIFIGRQIADSFYLTLGPVTLEMEWILHTVNIFNFILIIYSFHNIVKNNKVITIKEALWILLISINLLLSVSLVFKDIARTVISIYRDNSLYDKHRYLTQLIDAPLYFITETNPEIFILIIIISLLLIVLIIAAGLIVRGRFSKIIVSIIGIIVTLNVLSSLINVFGFGRIQVYGFSFPFMDYSLSSNLFFYVILGIIGSLIIHEQQNHKKSMA